MTCSCIYRITSNIREGKYKYGIILHLKIHLLYFKVCMWIYNIIRNITLGIYENWTILHLIIQLTNFKVCSYIYAGYVLTEHEES